MGKVDWGFGRRSIMTAEAILTMVLTRENRVEYGPRIEEKGIGRGLRRVVLERSALAVQ